jgi:hypothetical protein
MAEYASKGLANGLGIPAVTLAGLALLNQSSNGNGILGGLLGGNNCCEKQMVASGIIAQKDSYIAKLEAEKYSDNVSKDVYIASRNETQALGERLLEKYINPIATEVADNRVSMARMQEEIKCINEKSALREQLTNARINEVALIANNGITALQGQVNCLAQTVNGITKVVVPNTSVCPGWGNVTVTPATTTPTT